MTKSATAKAAAEINPTKTAVTPKRTRSTKRSTPAAPKASADTAIAPAASYKSVLKAPSKQDRLAALLVRDEGASLDQMVAATGWLPHTTRAALTGLKKKGYAISSDKIDGLRTYRAVAPQ